MMNDKKYKIRLVIAGMIIGCAIGWQLNNFTRYVVEINRKASLCDRLHCDDIAALAVQTEALKLPLPAAKVSK